MRTPRAAELATKIREIVGNIYGQTDVSHTFNIAPRIAQTIESLTQQENEFLKKINVVPVNEMKGDVLGFGAPNRLRKRTTTSNPSFKKRRPSDPTSLVQRQYECEDYESDALIGWKQIDSWAHLPDFYGRYRNSILQARANDKLAIGWNGQFSAADTDSTTYINLEDNAPGWIQYMIENAPEQVLGILPDATAPYGYVVDPINVGPGGDFESFDELVYHMRQTMIHKSLRKRTGMRAIMGDDLVLSENSSLFGADTAPTERLARNLYLNSQTFGRTDIETSDEFPDRGLVVTELQNLSIYFQEDAMRRKIEDDHNEKGIIDYEYGREDHVLEVAEGCAMVHPDAIKLRNAAGDAWVSAADTWKKSV